MLQPCRRRQKKGSVLWPLQDRPRTKPSRIRMNNLHRRWNTFIVKNRVNSTFYSVVLHLWHILPYLVQLLPNISFRRFWTQFYPSLALCLFLLDSTGMLRRRGTVKCVKIWGHNRYSCSDFSYPYVQILLLVLIFLNSGQHLTPCPIDTHKKTRFQSF